MLLVSQCSCSLLPAAVATNHKGPMSTGTNDKQRKATIQDEGTSTTQRIVPFRRMLKALGGIPARDILSTAFGVFGSLRRPTTHSKMGHEEIVQNDLT
eukprot:390484-Amphidinium_carterae.1